MPGADMAMARVDGLQGWAYSMDGSPDGSPLVLNTWLRHATSSDKLWPLAIFFEDQL